MLDAARFHRGIFRKFLISTAVVVAIVAASSLAPASAAHAAPTALRTATAGHLKPDAALTASDILPGTSIGTAWPPLQGGTTYSETQSYTEDWYALYKKHDTAIATITVTNTSNASLTCSSILAELYGVDGTSNSVDYSYLSANQAFTFTVPGFEAADPQGRYYLEILPNCSNGLPDGQTYTIAPSPGGEWTNPVRVPFASPLTPGPSVGTARPPLQGARVYSDTLTQGEDWFGLYKKSTSAVASIRVVNTTIDGSISCGSILVQLWGATGTSDSINYAYLSANQAYSFSVPGIETGDPEGRYYLEITPNCNNGLPDGQTYSVEPEPATQWANPAPVPSAPAVPATTIGGAWPPLRAGLVSTASLSAAESWYILYKKRDSATASIRVVNTTIDGSISCGSILVQLWGATGTSDSINYAYLSANQAYSFSVPGIETGDPEGRYYLEITPNCNNGLPDGQTYTVEPEPAAEWGANSRALPVGPSKKAAAGPLTGGVDYVASAASKGAQDWAYFTTKGTALIRMDDTSASSAGCRLVVTSGNSAVALSPGQVAVLHVAKAGTYYLELTPNSGCAPRSALSALLELSGSVSGPVLTVTDPALAAGVVKKAYGATIHVAGGKKPYTFAALTALPPGLKLNAKTGAVTGKPTKAGRYTLLIKVTDAAKPAHNAITVPVTITVT